MRNENNAGVDLDKLEPCPFCGGSDTFVERLDYSAAYVQCDSRIDEHCACLARGPVGVQDDDGEEIPGAAAAVRAWNDQAARRASASQISKDAVFIVEAGVDYEGSKPVRAFASADEAEAYARECTEHLAKRPQFPDGDLTQADIDGWAASERAWSEAHEAGQCGSSDWFRTVEVPFAAMSAGAAAKTEQAPALYVRRCDIDGTMPGDRVLAYKAPVEEWCVPFRPASAASAGSEQQGALPAPKFASVMHIADEFGSGAVAYTEDEMRAALARAAGAGSEQQIKSWPQRLFAPGNRNVQTAMEAEIRDLRAALARAPLPEQDDDTRDAALEEAAGVFESAAKHNAKEGRTVFAHEQQARTGRMRAAMSASRPDDKGSA
jgi:hypothetical protein